MPAPIIGAICPEAVRHSSSEVRKRSASTAKKKYQLETLPGETFSGLQLMCLMHAGFKRLSPELDTGMELEAPFLQALELFNSGADSDE
ncbi:MAG: hypothetical protein ABIR38_00555 [Chthoniobacterales bacterium]